MKSLLRTLFLVAATLLGVSQTAALAAAPDPENTLYLDIPYGRVVIQMRPDLAPNHVARIKQLVRQKFYDGLKFHRVIPGFMAQTGDPLGNGTGGSGQNIKAEFSSAHFARGVVGMARASDPDSADSQFFIMFADGGSLDGQYTVWGQVVSGMEFVDKIKTGSEEPNGAFNVTEFGTVQDPDKIIRMQVAADADKK